MFAKPTKQNNHAPDSVLLSTVQLEIISKKSGSAFVSMAYRFKERKVEVTAKLQAFGSDSILWFVLGNKPTTRSATTEYLNSLVNGEDSSSRQIISAILKTAPLRCNRVANDPTIM